MFCIFLPRGIRNNNPGNLRLSKTTWEGQKPMQADPDFAEFSTPLYGLRALMKVLLTYHLKYDLDTVASLINRFAPPHENATDRYIYAVSKALGVRRTDKIALTSAPVLIALTCAIVRHENGPPPPARSPDWYEQALYTQAAGLVLPLTV
ncbi:MAG: structural protein [Proteobacteria bacterium]|nr:structural protein [Pseudomonadota bacterium]